MLGYTLDKNHKPNPGNQCWPLHSRTLERQNHSIGGHFPFPLCQEREMSTNGMILPLQGPVVQCPTLVSRGWLMVFVECVPQNELVSVRDHARGGPSHLITQGRNPNQVKIILFIGINTKKSLWGTPRPWSLTLTNSFWGTHSTKTLSQALETSLGHCNSGPGSGWTFPFPSCLEMGGAQNGLIWPLQGRKMPPNLYFLYFYTMFYIFFIFFYIFLYFFYIFTPCFGPLCQNWQLFQHFGSSKRGDSACHNQIGLPRSAKSEGAKRLDCVRLRIWNAARIITFNNTVLYMFIRLRVWNATVIARRQLEIVLFLVATCRLSCLSNPERQGNKDRPHTSKTTKTVRGLDQNRFIPNHQIVLLSPKLSKTTKTVYGLDQNRTILTTK